MTQHDRDLWAEVGQLVSQLVNIPVEQIPTLKEVQSLRAVYKILGKDPSRYRGSNEALLRRIVQDKGLYKVNTVVDINNLVSLESCRSVASYDRAKLGDEIEVRRGKKGESYQAIGKGTLNIEGLPVFADAAGPFGSTTADSKRAMITPETTELLLVVVSFNDSSGLENQLSRAKSLLERYARARDVCSEIVR
ncbi:MAG: phenylalanine--tRNA ligase beta subunit-related protein [Acidiferrobacterales bacterium]|nr:phenylalanine--tRNA ligase beta subunit-related protein [Acidiferrobacterales bacterium]